MDARCPLCTAVFQTDRTGVQFCPNCGQQVNVADTSGPGAPRPSAAGPNFGIPPTPPPASGGGTGGGTGEPREPTPWERRAELGFFAAFFGTLKEVLFNPTAFFSRARTNEPVWDAIAFSWLCTIIWFVLSIPFSLATGGMNRRMVAQYQRLMEQWPNLPPEVRKKIQDQIAETVNITPGRLVAHAIGAMLLTMALILLWAVILHLFALMTGAAKNGIGATLRATAYGSAPVVVAFVPYLNILAFIYVAVVTIIGLAHLQQTTGGRAAAAYLLPTFIFCCCCCAVLVLAAVGMAGAMGQMSR